MTPLAPASEPSAVARRALLWSVAFYLFTRAVILAVALLAPQNRSTSRPFDWWPDNPLIRWDSGHYLRIMCVGYPPWGADGTIYDTTAFFPLSAIVSWPVWQAIRGVVGLAGGDVPPVDPSTDWTAHLAVVLVSHLTGLIAVVLLHLWCQRLLGAAAALRASLLFCAFPAAMYLSTGYGEGVFVMCVALGILMQARGRPVWAAAACALATAARPTGVVLAIALFLLNLGHPAELPAMKRFRRAVLLGFLSVGGLFAHFGYLWSYYGRADAYFIAQKTWELKQEDRSWARAVLLQPVLDPATKPIRYAIRGEFSKLLDARNWNRFLNVLMVGLAIAGLVRPGPIPRPLLLITLLVFVMAWLPDPYDGGRMLGITRYHIVDLPVFAWLASTTWLRRSAITTAVIVLWLLVLQAFYMAGYVDWVLVS